ncbi:HIT family protein [Candidatus Saccharibacteria bacterium]|nr:HIT family protein [Candidatus Saccharibacteria bacterium]
MSTIFTKIIKGEIPAYKIYEDEKTYAFLDNNPKTRGHVLVVPKIEVDKVYDLPDDYYAALWDSVKKVCHRLEEVYHTRALIQVMGTDVPHSHVHVFPLDETWEPGRHLSFTPEEYEEIRKELAF